MTCGCCYRRGNLRHCDCVVGLCRRCAYCVRHCGCDGPKGLRESIDEVLQRVVAELNAAGGPFADLHTHRPRGALGTQGSRI